MTNIKKLQEDIANAKIKTPEKSVEEIVNELFEEKYNAKDILINNWEYFIMDDLFVEACDINSWIKWFVIYRESRNYPSENNI